MLRPREKPKLNRARFDCCLHSYRRDDPLIFGYKHAAEQLITDLNNGSCTQYDSILYPICFLYRHYLELLLKQTIKNLGYFLDKKEETDTFLNKSNHGIKSLWDKFFGYLRLDPDYTDLLNKEIKPLYKNIEYIENLDKSTAFRYHRNKNGGAILRDNKNNAPLVNFNILDFRENVTKVTYHLEYLNIDIDTKLDYKINNTL